VVVGWPPGRVAHPSELASDPVARRDYWPLALPALALVWGGVVWWAFGRDPASNRSVKPEYAPPADLIPAEAARLVDERAHPRDVIGDGRGPRGARLSGNRAHHDGLRRSRLHVQAAEAGRRRSRPEGFRALRARQDLRRRLGDHMRLLSEVRRDYENVFPPIRDRLYV